MNLLVRIWDQNKFISHPHEHAKILCDNYHQLSKVNWKKCFEKQAEN